LEYINSLYLLSYTISERSDEKSFDK
jgi:hypothetical protein